MSQRIPNFAQYRTVGEAAEFLGVSAATLRNWDRSGKLKPRRHPQNGYRIYLHQDLEAILRSADLSLVRDESFAPLIDWSEMRETEHFVQFYESDEFLAESVCGFIGAALIDGQCGIVLGTSPHRVAIERALSASGMEPARAIEQGRLVVLDAAETVSRLMSDGMPDARRFQEIIGSIVTRLNEGNRRVHAFGEMVALLWAEGKREAALRLEELWSELGKTARFALCCAYPVAAFRNRSDAAPLESVCKYHSRVIPSESYSAIDDPYERLAAITRLQQKAWSLEAEIAHRSETEKQLKRRERELADFFENGTEGLHKVGPDGRILWANKAELALLGYDSNEYIGHHIAEFHVDSDVIHDILRNLLSGKDLLNCPARLRCKNGSVKDVLINSSACFEAGKFLYTRCFTRDVTEIKEAERDRAVLAAIVASSQDAIIAMTFDGVIRSWNAGAERLFGYTEREAIGQPIRLIVPPTKYPESEEILRRLRGGDRIEHFETTRIAKSGRLIDISLTVSPLRDSHGTLIGASKIARDITDRKRDEQALRDQKEDLQTLLATLPVAVFFAEDPECRRISGNRAAAQLLRMSLGDNLSKSAPPGEQPTHFRLLVQGVEVPPEDLPIQRAARGIVVYSEAVDHEFSDGTVVHTLVSAQPLFDSSGEPRGAIACILDVSELKRAEIALREADRRKDEFLATLAHELRNPLAPIRNGIEILRLDPADSSLAREARNIMQRQLEHLTRLVDDLLDVSRITRNKIELRKQHVQLADVVASAVEASRPLINAHGHELTVSLPAEPVTLNADPTRMAQIFSNLLNNSAKYTERGGRISLRAERLHNAAVVTVADNGIGIHCDSLAYVFDMFQQADRSLERAQGGLGIGLTLVRRLVELHGGTINAQSEGPGKGSAFTVQLPITPIHADPAALAEPGTGPKSARRRILVVDDNKDSVLTLSALLQIKGHEVRGAGDGLEAIQLAADFLPEIILMDVGMPRLNGYDATRRIRATPWGNKIFIVALSGWGQAEDLERSAEAGCSAHLTKPVDFAALEELLVGLSSDMS